MIRYKYNKKGDKLTVIYDGISEEYGPFAPGPIYGRTLKVLKPSWWDTSSYFDKRDFLINLECAYRDHPHYVMKKGHKVTA